MASSLHRHVRELRVHERAASAADAAKSAATTTATTTIATASWSASTQVLTSRELFFCVLEFMPGIPYFLVTFKKQVRTEQDRLKGRLMGPQSSSRSPAGMEDAPYKLKLKLSYETLLLKSDAKLWQFAVLQQRKRVLKALSKLARPRRLIEVRHEDVVSKRLRLYSSRQRYWVPDYTTSRHVDFKGVMKFAVVRLVNTSFLDWIYSSFRSIEQRQIPNKLFTALARVGRLTVLQWAHFRGYDFPANMMDAAASGGHLALVRFLHEHGCSGCTTHAMDDAAKHGHLDVVKFLHENRTEGCTDDAKGRALHNGHLDVLKFLHEHRVEECSSVSVLTTGGTVERRIECIEFALVHHFRGFECCVMCCAVIGAHFDIVKFLHKNRAEGCCSAETLLSAKTIGRREVADYLCSKRPANQHVKPESIVGSDRSMRRGQLRLATMLLRSVLTSRMRSESSGRKIPKSILKRNPQYELDEWMIKKAYPLE